MLFSLDIGDWNEPMILSFNILFLPYPFIQLCLLYVLLLLWDFLTSASYFWLFFADLVPISPLLLFCLFGMTIVSGASYLLSWSCLPPVTSLSTMTSLPCQYSILSFHLSLWHVFTCVHTIYRLDVLLCLIESVSKYVFQIFSAFHNQLSEAPFFHYWYL